MDCGKNRWFKVVSCILTFSFLINSPSQASLIDALKPTKTDSQEIRPIETDIAASSHFQITDPEKIIIAENIGRIRETFKGHNGKLVINIQDAHCNFEAQTNISQILDGLVRDAGLKVVALEGSTGEIDPSIFTTFPDEEIRKEVATYFLKKGKINGAEYLAITSKNPPRLYGVEKKEYYLANLSTFLNTLKGRDKIKAACAKIRDTLDKFKVHLYSKELRELDAKTLANKNDDANLVEYCTFLKGLAEAKRVALNGFANLGLLYRAIDIENAIDFKKVEQERARLISNLEKVLSEEGIQELFTKSVHFKNGRINGANYHLYLRRLGQEKGADLTKYPNLNLYVTYLFIYEKIDSQALLRELGLLEGAVKERLFKNEAQRMLDKLSRNIRLLESMLDISLSREDVEYYLKNKDTFLSQAFIDFIKKYSQRYKEPLDYNPDFVLIDRYLPDFENFYRIAETRDDAIIENTLRKMEEEDVQAVALITGGYHTEGIAERLRNRGISYVVISPRITKPDKDNPYLEILSGEKIPTETTSKQNLAVNSSLPGEEIDEKDNVAIPGTLTTHDLYQAAQELGISKMVVTSLGDTASLSSDEVDDSKVLTRLRREVGDGWGGSLVDLAVVSQLREYPTVEEIAQYLWFQVLYKREDYSSICKEREEIRTLVNSYLDNEFSELDSEQRSHIIDHIFQIVQVDYPQARMLATLEGCQHINEELSLLKSGQGTVDARIEAVRKAIGWWLLVEEDEENPIWIGHENLWTSLIVRLLSPQGVDLAKKVQGQIDELEGQCRTCGTDGLRNYPAPMPEDMPRDGEAAVPEFFMAAMVGAIDAVYNNAIQPGGLKTLPAPYVQQGHTDKTRFATSAYALANYQGLNGIRLLAEQDELLTLLGSVASRVDPVMIETVDPVDPDSVDHHMHSVTITDVKEDAVFFIDNEEVMALPKDVFLIKYKPTGVVLLSSEQRSKIKPEHLTDVPEEELKNKLWCCGIVWFIGDFNGLHVVLDALKTLFYRAPDASGVGKIVSTALRQLEEGTLFMPQEHLTRRVIGAAGRLYYYLAANPIFKDGSAPEEAEKAWQEVARREGIDSQRGRNLCVEAGYTMGSLYGYEQGGKQSVSTSIDDGINVGDYGAPSPEIPFTLDSTFSALDELRKKHNIPIEVVKQVIKRSLIAALRKTLTWEDLFVLDEEQRRDRYVRETELLQEAIDNLSDGLEVPQTITHRLTGRSEFEGGEMLEPYGGLPNGIVTAQGRVDLAEVGFAPLAAVAAPIGETWKWSREDENEARRAAWEEYHIEIGTDVDFRYIPKRYIIVDGRKVARIDAEIGVRARLFGKIRLGRGVKIGRRAEITDSRIEAGCEIGKGTEINNSILAAGAKVRRGAEVHNSLVGVGAEIVGKTTHVIDSIIGEGAYIQDANNIDHYQIGRNSRIIKSNFTMLPVEGEGIGFFGMRDRVTGKPIEPTVAIEIGGQEVWIYPGLNLAEAVKIATNRLDSRMQEMYRHKLEEYEQDLRAQRTDERGLLGFVGEGVYIKGANEVRGVNIGDYAILDHPGVLVNATILSDLNNITRISHGAQVSDSIVQWGAKIFRTGTIINRSMLLEHTQVGNGEVVQDSIIGPNSELEKGEIKSSLVGAHTVSHHRTSIIGAWIPEHGVNFGSGTQFASNHPGILADQTGVLKRGCFTGLASAHQAPVSYTSFTFVGLGTDNIEGVVQVPFSVIRKPTKSYPGTMESEVIPLPEEGQMVSAIGGRVSVMRVGGRLKFGCFPTEKGYLVYEEIDMPEVGKRERLTRVSDPDILDPMPSKNSSGIWVYRMDERSVAVSYKPPTISPALNQIQPGGLLSSNPYKLKRDQRKWQTRTTATRHAFNFEIFQPDVVDEMINARDLFAMEPAVVKEGYTDKDEKERYYDMIGKNYLTEEDRQRAVIDYTASIRLYAFSGLMYQVAEVLKTVGARSWDDLRARLTAEPKTKRWAHERKVLEQETGKSLTAATSEDFKSWLGEAARLKRVECQRVFDAKQKGWERGLLRTPAYRETHGAVPNSIRFTVIMEHFDKLFNFKFSLAKDPEIKAKFDSGPQGAKEIEEWWNEIYSFIKDLEFKVPPDFDDDLVRDTFRKLDTEVLTTLLVRPEFKKELENEFKARVAENGGDRTLSWPEAWLLEARLNRAGVAYTSAVAWFQKRAAREGAIPLELIEDGTIKFGVMDRLTAQLLPDDDLAHGRWSTIALNTLFAAQPVPTPDGRRMVGLNGDVGRTINGARRSILSKRYKFMSRNDAETIAVQWHDNFTCERGGLLEETLKAEWDPAQVEEQKVFLEKLDENGITNPDERAARLTAFQLSEETSWAVAMSSIHDLPRRRYGISSNRPISLIRLGPNLVCASDPIAALAYFPEVDREEAIKQIEEYRNTRDATIKTLHSAVELSQISKSDANEKNREAIQNCDTMVKGVMARFSVQGVELTGADKFFRTYRVIDPQSRSVITKVEISHYDGTPYILLGEEGQETPPGVARSEVLRWKTLPLDPTIVNMGLFEHINEIPRVYRENVINDIGVETEGRPQVDISAKARDGRMERPGLLLDVWRDRFGNRIEGLELLYLFGYGSSNRAARMTTPLFERLLPQVIVEAPPPPEYTPAVNREYFPKPRNTAALKISLSGETHGILMLMNLLKEVVDLSEKLRGIMQVAISGKPASTLFRNLAEDYGTGEGGALDIRTGPEVTVATVKGVAGQIIKLCEVAIQVAQEMEVESRLRLELIEQLQGMAGLAEQVIASNPSNPETYQKALARNQHMKAIAQKFFGRREIETEEGMKLEPSEYDSAIVLGGDWSGYEGELKFEEISNVPAYFANFRQMDRAVGLLLRQAERAKVDPRAPRTLLYIDETFSQWHPEAVAAIKLFSRHAETLGLKFVVNSAFENDKTIQEAEKNENIDLLHTPKVNDHLQSLLTLPTYDWFGTELALARGLSYAQTNQSKNLTKAVTVGFALQEERLKKMRAALFSLQDYKEASSGINPDLILHNYRQGAGQLLEGQPSIQTSLVREPLLVRDAVEKISPSQNEIRIGTLAEDTELRKVVVENFGDSAANLRHVVLLVDSDIGYAVAKGMEYQLRYLLRGLPVQIRFVGEQIKVFKGQSLLIGISTPGQDSGMAEIINNLTNKGVATLCLADSSLKPRLQANIGTLVYPDHTDPVGFYGVAYTYLLGMGLVLGQTRGLPSDVDVASYARGLHLEPAVMAQFYQESTVIRDMEKTLRSIKNDPNVLRLDRVQIIAGRQSYGSAVLFAYYLNIWAGVHAEVLLLDESYHGPIAVVPEVPIFVFATDDIAFPQALYDGGVNKSKAGNVTVILQEGDDQSEGVRELRPDNIIRLPKLPDPLVNPVDGLFAQRFAIEWAKALGADYHFSEAEVMQQINSTQLKDLMTEYNGYVNAIRKTAPEMAAPVLVVSYPEGQLNVDVLHQYPKLVSLGIEETVELDKKLSEATEKVLNAKPSIDKEFTRAVLVQNVGVSIERMVERTLKAYELTTAFFKDPARIQYLKHNPKGVDYTEVIAVIPDVPGMLQEITRRISALGDVNISGLSYAEFTIAEVKFSVMVYELQAVVDDVPKGYLSGDKFDNLDLSDISPLEVTIEEQRSTELSTISHI